MASDVHDAQRVRRGGANERRRGAVTVASTIQELRDPLDALILEGQDLVDPLRLIPFRHIAGLGDCAERVLSLLFDIDAFLGALSGSTAERGGESGHADPRGVDDRYAAQGWLGSLRSRVPDDPAG